MYTVHMYAYIYIYILFLCQNFKMFSEILNQISRKNKSKTSRVTYGAKETINQQTKQKGSY